MRRMRAKLILPALTEATSPFFRPVKYSLFPPLGLAALAAYFDPEDEVEIVDEHVERLRLEDEPDVVAIEVYITSAYRAYEIADHYRARGVHVILGGLHVTSMPEEALRHADTICIGPGDGVFGEFVRDLRAGRPRPVYRAQKRSLLGLPRPRRDLIRRRNYLVPNSLVVTRGCPHHCDFCYKDPFFAGGPGFYTQAVDEALADIAALPGRHLYFLDDHLLGNARFASDLFRGMRGMKRVWQAAGTVQSVLRPGLLEEAVESGLRSLFVGFESVNAASLREQGKAWGTAGAAAVHRLHDLGVMVNGSFVFGMDADDASVFDRTVEWAVEQGIETATFHILTPYPTTRLHARMAAAGRITTSNWDLYDTRHAVFTPAQMTPKELECGHWRAYRDFYSWSSIAQACRAHDSAADALRHFAYAAAWKKCEPLWDAVIRLRQLSRALPLLERVLDGRATSRRSEPCSTPVRPQQPAPAPLP